jgi:hypothetical protein
MIGFILFAHLLFISIQEMYKSTDIDSMVNLQKKKKKKKMYKKMIQNTSHKEILQGNTGIIGS